MLGTWATELPRPLSLATLQLPRGMHLARQHFKAPSLVQNEEEEDQDDSLKTQASWVYLEH